MKWLVASLTETYPHRLSVVTPEKGASIKFWPEGAEFLCKHNFQAAKYKNIQKGGICCTSVPCNKCPLNGIPKDHFY